MNISEIDLAILKTKMIEYGNTCFACGAHNTDIMIEGSYEEYDDLLCRSKAVMKEFDAILVEIQSR